MTESFPNMLHSDSPEVLRACIRDLIAFTALPAVWVNCPSSRLADSLADVLVATLQIKLVYVRVLHEEGPGIEVVRGAGLPSVAAHAKEITSALQSSVNGAGPNQPHTVSVPSLGTFRVMTVPIECLGHGQIGTVLLGSEQPSFPTDIDRLLLRAAANHAAIAIVESRRRQAEESEIREETDTLETLNRIGQTLAAQLDVSKVVQAVTNAATQLSGAAFGAFFYNHVNDRGESYQLYTLSGVPREDFKDFPMPRNTVLFGSTFRGEGIIRLGDVTQDPRFGTMPPYHGMPAGHLPVKSYLAVPVVSRSGEVLGGLFLGHARPDVFTARHERIVAGLAAQAAVAMDNARLYEAAQRARRQAEEGEARYRRLVQELQASQEQLQEKVEELQNFEEVVVGRELRMMELERELARLRKEHQQPSASCLPGKSAST